MREPDKDKKLSRILKYISGTRDLVLTLESDGTGTVKWWVDAAFEMHHNIKSQTGVIMSMEQGGPVLRIKQTKTEHEELNRSGAGRSG